MRMLNAVALSTIVATGVFGLTALASSAYAQEPFWQGAPHATGPDAAQHRNWQRAPTSSRWRADTSGMGRAWGSDSSSSTESGYGLGPGTNGPSSINNGQ
jgi:hypothetical protein